jgi:hypothetical protein
VSGQGTLFETPKERHSREYNQRLAEYMAAREVPAGYQCQECGGVSPNQSRYWADHGLMGTRCLREHLRRNHARYALRCGDIDFWVRATADLRLIAAWRASTRNTNGKKDTA